MQQAWFDQWGEEKKLSNYLVCECMASRDILYDQVTHIHQLLNNINNKMAICLKIKNCIFLHNHLCDLSKIFCSMLFTLFCFDAAINSPILGVVFLIVLGWILATWWNNCRHTHSWQLLVAMNKQDVWWCNALTERESCYKHTQRAVSKKLECILYTCQNIYINWRKSVIVKTALFTSNWNQITITVVKNK